MTEGTEHALELVSGGVLFCMAIWMLLILHTSFVRQTESMYRMPECIILFEESEEKTWKHLDE